MTRLGCLLFILMLVLFACFPTVTRAQGVEVRLTAYSCDYHPNNKMATTPGMCEVTFSGRDPSTRGAACPYEWLGEWIEVEGRRWLCDDLSSFSHTTWNGLPHIDLRVASYAEAYAYGVQVVEVERLGNTAAAVVVDTPPRSNKQRVNKSARRGRGPL